MKMAKHSPRFVKLVEEVKTRIREVGIADVQARLERGETFHLVDVREESEWAKGHLPQAIHLGKGVIERDIEKQIADMGAEIVLYCGGGSRSPGRRQLATDGLHKRLFDGRRLPRLARSRFADRTR